MKALSQQPKQDRPVLAMVVLVVTLSGLLWFVARAPETPALTPIEGSTWMERLGRAGWLP